jgi:hypothetical protein
MKDHFAGCGCDRREAPRNGMGTARPVFLDSAGDIRRIDMVPLVKEPQKEAIGLDPWT